MKYTFLFFCFLFSAISSGQSLEVAEELSRKGQLPEANDSLTVFIQNYPLKRYERAAAYYLRAQNHLAMGNIAVAEEDNRASLKIRQSLIPEEAGKNLSLSAAINLAQGESELALAQLKEAGNYPYIDEPEFPAIISLLTGKALLSLNQARAARDSYQEGINILNVVGETTEGTMADLHFQTGLTYLSDKEWKKAKEWMEKAIALSTSDADLKAESYIALGSIHDQLGNHKDALANFRLASRMYLKKFGEYAPQTAYARLEQARYYVNIENNKSAKDLLDRTIHSLCPNLENKQLPEAGDFCGDFSLLVEALQLKSKVDLQHFEDTQDISALTQAAEAAQRSIDFFELWAVIYDNDIDIDDAWIMDNYLTYYDHTIYTLLTQGQQLKNQAPAKDAFILAGHAARLKQLKKARTLNKVTLQQGLEEERNGLLQNLNKVTYQYLNNPAKEGLKTALHSQRKAYYGFIASLKAQDPLYYNTIYGFETPGLETLQKEMSRKEAQLRYFIGAEQYYVFGLSRRDFEVKMLSLYYHASITKHKHLLTTNVKSLMADFPAIIQTNDTSAFVEVSPLLYDCLFTPINDLIKRKKRLSILSDVKLPEWPYHALMENEKEAARYQSLKEANNDFKIQLINTL